MGYPDFRSEVRVYQGFLRVQPIDFACGGGDEGYQRGAVFSELSLFGER
jgi:hypothetical protein